MTDLGRLFEDEVLAAFYSPQILSELQLKNLVQIKK